MQTERISHPANHFTTPRPSKGSCTYMLNYTNWSKTPQLKNNFLKFAQCKGSVFHLPKEKIHNFPVRLYRLIYIDGDGLGYGLEFRFQTRWLHCYMQNIAHCTNSDSDPYSIFLCNFTIFQLGDLSPNPNQWEISA